MKLFVLLLFMTNIAYGGVWYYGTGEAVNVENQIGFENSTTKIDADGNNLNVKYDGGDTVQDQDRQFEVGELLPNAGFERDDLSMVSCTDATVQRVTSLTGGEFNQHALEITATGTDWSCDITSSGSAGQGFLNVTAQSDTAGDAFLCVLRNGVEDACHQNSIIGVPAPFTIPASLGDTSNGYRIKGSASGTVVVVDKGSIKPGGIQVGEYYREEIINLAGSGNFTGGSILVQRRQNIVTLSWLTLLTHASASAPASAAGALPEWATPDRAFYQIFTFGGSEIFRIGVLDTGVINCTYRNASLNFANREDCAAGAVISYPVAQSQSVSSFPANVYGSDLLATSVTDQSISTEATVSFSDTPKLDNGTFSSNQFTVGQSGHYEILFNSAYTRGAIDSPAFDLSAFVRINSTNFGVCQRRSRYDGTTLATSAVSSSYRDITCYHKAFLNKGDVVSIRAVSGETVTFGARTFSVTRYLNPNGESVTAIVKDAIYAGTDRVKICRIRQTSATTTAAFESPDGCFGAGSRDSTGVYIGVEFTPGYFKAGGKVECAGLVMRLGAGDTPSLCETQQLETEDDTFRVVCRNTNNSNIDRSWSLICFGERP